MRRRRDVREMRRPAGSVLRVGRPAGGVRVTPRCREDGLDQLHPGMDPIQQNFERIPNENMIPNIGVDFDPPSPHFWVWATSGNPYIRTLSYWIARRMSSRDVT